MAFKKLICGFTSHGQLEGLDADNHMQYWNDARGKAGIFVAPLTDGSIPFADSAGKLAQDNANLFWDDTNKRLGIGTNSPKRQLDFDGANIRTQRQLDTDLNTNLGYGTFGAGNLAHTTGNEGWYNSAFGINALHNVTTGNSNMGFGSYTLYDLTTGTANIAIGASTARGNTTGSYNVAIGRLALNANTIGSYNTGIGAYALRNILPTVSGEGEKNIGIGYYAGSNLTTGSRNIIMGSNIDVPSATGDDQLNIGDTIYGDLSSGSVSLGTDTPDASAILDLTSTVRGFLPPRMTTAQRNAISSPATSLMVYDTDLDQWFGYNGSSWVILG